MPEITIVVTVLPVDLCVVIAQRCGWKYQEWGQQPLETLIACATQIAYELGQQIGGLQRSEDYTLVLRTLHYHLNNPQANAHPETAS